MQIPFEADKLWVWLLGLVSAAGAWLVRRVLTNEKQIAVMQTHEKDRDDHIRQIQSQIKDHNNEVKDELRTIRGDIKSILLSQTKSER